MFKKEDRKLKKKKKKNETSILTNVSKILEQLTFEQISNFMELLKFRLRFNKNTHEFVNDEFTFSLFKS